MDSMKVSFITLWHPCQLNNLLSICICDNVSFLFSWQTRNKNSNFSWEDPTNAMLFLVEYLMYNRWSIIISHYLNLMGTRGQWNCREQCMNTVLSSTPNADAGVMTNTVSKKNDGMLNHLYRTECKYYQPWQNKTDKLGHGTRERKVVFLHYLWYAETKDNAFY